MIADIGDVAGRGKRLEETLVEMARPKGFEPLTF